MQDERKKNSNKSHNEPNKCSWCNASLPADIAFQKYHMLKVHGQVV